MPPRSKLPVRATRSIRSLAPSSGMEGIDGVEAIGIAVSAKPLEAGSKRRYSRPVKTRRAAAEVYSYKEIDEDEDSDDDDPLDLLAQTHSESEFEPEYIRRVTSTTQGYETKADLPPIAQTIPVMALAASIKLDARADLWTLKGKGKRMGPQASWEVSADIDKENQKPSAGTLNTTSLKLKDDDPFCAQPKSVEGKAFGQMSPVTNKSKEVDDPARTSGHTALHQYSFDKYWPDFESLYADLEDSDDDDDDDISMPSTISSLASKAGLDLQHVTHIYADASLCAAHDIHERGEGARLIQHCNFDRHSDNTTRHRAGDSDIVNDAADAPLPHRKNNSPSTASFPMSSITPFATPANDPFFDHPPKPTSTVCAEESDSPPAVPDPTSPVSQPKAKRVKRVQFASHASVRLYEYAPAPTTAAGPGPVPQSRPFSLGDLGLFSGMY